MTQRSSLLFWHICIWCTGTAYSLPGNKFLGSMWMFRVSALALTDLGSNLCHGCRSRHWEYELAFTSPYNRNTLEERIANISDLTASPVLPGALEDNKCRWRWSWLKWGQHEPWAGYWERGMSYFQAAEPLPEELYHPSFSAPEATGNLWERQWDSVSCTLAIEITLYNTFFTA